MKNLALGIALATSLLASSAFAAVPALVNNAENIEAKQVIMCPNKMTNFNEYRLAPGGKAWPLVREGRGSGYSHANYNIRLGDCSEDTYLGNLDITFVNGAITGIKPEIYKDWAGKITFQIDQKNAITFCESQSETGVNCYSFTVNKK